MARSRNVLDGVQFHDLIEECIYESDEFRMYGFKVKRCANLRNHDWTSCPFAHQGEKAERRDPRLYHYIAIPCPTFRNFENCRRGHLCPYAHGIFEYWLHPAKYRTRFCNSGDKCNRKVCFFAHSERELREETRYEWYYVDEHPYAFYAIGYELENEIVVLPALRREAPPAPLPEVPPAVSNQINGYSYEEGTSELANILGMLNIRDGQYELPRTLERRASES